MAPLSRTDPVDERSGRLATDDAPFWFATPALGWSVVLQIVWVFDDEVSLEALTAMNAALARGRMHRMLVPSTVYGSRPRWAPAPDAPGLAVDPLPIPDAGVDAWATAEMSTVPLDAEGGRCWRLRCAPTESGGTVLSLCALHVVTDGRGMVAAAAEAARESGVPVAVANERSSTTGSSGSGESRRPVAPGSRRRGRLDDLADAVAQAGAVVVGLARAVAERRKASGLEPDPRPERPPLAERSPAAKFTWATASIPAGDWDRVAAEYGGTSNTLFIAVVSGLLRSSGRSPLGTPIKVGVPVDRREGDEDTRTNAIAGVSVFLTGEPVPGGDLAGIRAACKAAFVRLSEGRRAPHIYLRPLAWFLPPSVLIKLVGGGAGKGMPDAVISNIGEVMPEATVVGGRTARRMALRGTTQGVDPAAGHRFGDGVQSWLIRTPEQVSFTVLGLDDEAFGSDAVLRDLLTRELAAWELPHDIW
ncbi:hypothetical protein RVF83_14795 [Gordonia rubripertincta]|uniref:Uncharacterized protein n=2 Tax=Gordonia rubripertincta TaxID=36822 RepID=A0AAW6R339_GORRU|nr:hypothetical protein [Gordonia rubripertincta]ASR02660.1 hypothetical protein GCWB2_09255 [Gordonia rubripertincta]MDG6780052.1 hypothetical protein [Gordonia rubripertincta]NKY65254.1 hypothetical protein [Gordonia rubripertincta]QMU20234.1 hypothetical protein H3V45_19705 [Gordonia rubripertincta]GAB84652.1 hypothetical protein GORBP_043_00340 [Gordonia rubripertincta NBRC 101908]